MIELRVYALAQKHFTKIDTEARQLKDSVDWLCKKIEKASSELMILENEAALMEGSEKILRTSMISMKKTEIENLESKLNETGLKLKKIEAHPLHQVNRKKFIDDLEIPFNDYLKSTPGELKDEEDPCYHCFSLAEMGSNLAAVVKAVKQADEYKEGLEKVLSYLKNLDPTG